MQPLRSKIQVDDIVANARDGSHAEQGPCRVQHVLEEIFQPADTRETPENSQEY